MSTLVTDRQPCTEEEKQELLAYLRANSHVRLPIELLEAGWPLEKGKVKGVTNIGQLTTCFETLGDSKSQTLHGTKYFQVAQALAMFKDPGKDTNPNIPTDFKKIIRYRGQFAGPGSHPMVTIVEIPAGILIADGDKTAIAGLLYAEEAGRSDFTLPVYYVAPPPAPASSTPPKGGT